MTGQELIDLLKTGTKVIVRFTKCIEDIEGQFENGMLAEVIDAYVDNEFGDFIKIVVNEKDFATKNKDMEQQNWVEDKKYSEIHERFDVVDFFDNLNEDLLNVEVVQMNSLVKEYLESKSSLSYTRWLEEKVQSLLN